MKRITLGDLKKLRDHGPNAYTQAQFFALLDYAIGAIEEAAAKPRAR